MFDCCKAHAVADSVQLATETGRLDFLSAVLACLAIILVVAGIFAFLNLRALARSAAREESQKTAERAAVEYLQKELPTIVKEYRKLAENAVTAEQADQLVEGEEGADHGEKDKGGK